MKTADDKYRKKLLEEIQNTAGPKLFNVQHGTATDQEIHIVKECQAYLCLLNYSVLTAKQIYGYWEKSQLAYK